MLIAHAKLLIVFFSVALGQSFLEGREREVDVDLVEALDEALVEYGTERYMAGGTMACFRGTIVAFQDEVRTRMHRLPRAWRFPPSVCTPFRHKNLKLAKVFTEFRCWGFGASHQRVFTM